MARKFIYFEGGKMVTEEKCTGSKSSSSMEKFTVQIKEPMLYDRIRTLSAEYSVSEEFLINVAVKRLIDDIDFVRNLRIGKAELE